MKSRAVRFTVATILIATLAVACKKSAPPAFPVPEVEVIKAQAQTVPLTRDLVGRLSATRSADVRARVAGVLLKRLYVEGSDVKEGQPLFQIDPAPLQAALEGGSRARAGGGERDQRSRSFAQRTRELKTSGAVSKSDVDTAEANERSTAAAVQQARAEPADRAHQSRLRTVPAPISGPRGPAAGDRGRAGRPGRSDAAHHRRTDRSDLRELRSAGVRSPGAASRAGRGRRHAGGWQQGRRCN